MTSREIFIDVIDDLLRKTDLVAFCGEEDSQKVLEYFESLKAIPAKPEITEKGLEILQAMQSEVEVRNNLFKAADIGSILDKPAKAVSGSLRKLVSDGFVEKIGEKPIVYVLTEKGKTFEVEK